MYYRYTCNTDNNDNDTRLSIVDMINELETAFKYTKLNLKREPEHIFFWRECSKFASNLTLFYKNKIEFCGKIATLISEPSHLIIEINISFLIVFMIEFWKAR